jgi:hypothetical protein
MPTYAWQIHDTLISECKTRASLLTTEIHHAIGRITMQDSADVTGANHDTIVSKWEYVQAAEQLQQRIFALGNRAQMRWGSNRSGSSPYDTVPAERSAYAWALDVKPRQPVSPMRALHHLRCGLGEIMAVVKDL